MRGHQTLVSEKWSRHDLQSAVADKKAAGSSATIAEAKAPWVVLIMQWEDWGAQRGYI
jgi:hypothetical protein